MISGVYKILCLVSGRCYVGSSKDIKYRWKNHRHDLRRGVHSNFKLSAAWKKHGELKFEFIVIEECEASVRLQREEFWINELDSFKNGYNCSAKGSGATEKTIEKILAANKRRRGVSCGKGVPKSKAHAEAIAIGVQKAYDEGRGPSKESIRAGQARYRASLPPKQVVEKVIKIRTSEERSVSAKKGWEAAGPARAEAQAKMTATQWLPGGSLYEAGKKRWEAYRAAKEEKT